MGTSRSFGNYCYDSGDFFEGSFEQVERECSYSCVQGSLTYLEPAKAGVAHIVLCGSEKLCRIKTQREALAYRWFWKFILQNLEVTTMSYAYTCCNTSLCNNFEDSYRKKNPTSTTPTFITILITPDLQDSYQMYDDGPGNSSAIGGKALWIASFIFTSSLTQCIGVNQGCFFPLVG